MALLVLRQKVKVEFLAEGFEDALALVFELWVGKIELHWVKVELQYFVREVKPQVCGSGSHESSLYGLVPLFLGFLMLLRVLEVGSDDISLKFGLLGIERVSRI